MIDLAMLFGMYVNFWADRDSYLEREKERTGRASNPKGLTIQFTLGRVHM